MDVVPHPDVIPEDCVTLVEWTAPFGMPPIYWPDHYLDQSYNPTTMQRHFKMSRPQWARFLLKREFDAEADPKSRTS